MTHPLFEKLAACAADNDACTLSPEECMQLVSAHRGVTNSARDAVKAIAAERDDLKEQLRAAKSAIEIAHNERDEALEAWAAKDQLKDAA